MASKAKKIYIFGIHSVEAVFFKKPELLIGIFVIEDTHNNRLKNLLNLFKKIKIPVNELNSKDFNKLAKFEKHQGIVALINIPKFPSEIDLNLINFNSENRKLILILDSIQDPRNLGACLRNAAAFNVDAVVINKDGSAPINEYVFNSSVGAILHLNIFLATNLSRTIRFLQKNNFWIIGLDGYGESKITSENFPPKSVFVMGSEGKGIRKLVKDNCDQLIRIPISDEIESLNISVATGIALYEFSKQQNT